MPGDKLTLCQERNGTAGALKRGHTGDAFADAAEEGQASHSRLDRAGVAAADSALGTIRVSEVARELGLLLNCLMPGRMKWVQAGRPAQSSSRLTAPHGNRVRPAAALGAG